MNSRSSYNILQSLLFYELEVLAGVEFIVDFCLDFDFPLRLAFVDSRFPLGVGQLTDVEGQCDDGSRFMISDAKCAAIGIH